MDFGKREQLKKRQTAFISGLWFMALLVLAGCGVKGDPRPPLGPPNLSRGEPVYKLESSGDPPKRLFPYFEEDESPGSSEDDENPLNNEEEEDDE